jgi:hypothetical protein
MPIRSVKNSMRFRVCVRALRGDADRDTARALPAAHARSTWIRPERRYARSALQGARAGEVMGDGPARGRAASIWSMARS